LKGERDIEAALKDQTENIQAFLEKNVASQRDYVSEDDQIWNYWQEWGSPPVPAMLEAQSNE
jgi:hypothetical protein